MKTDLGAKLNTAVSFTVINLIYLALKIYVLFLQSIYFDDVKNSTMESSIQVSYAHKLYIKLHSTLDFITCYGLFLCDLLLCDL